MSLEVDGHGPVHVMPINDAVEHAISEGCVCGPSLERVDRDAGGDAWLVVHHSLDGREHHERERS